MLDDFRRLEARVAKLENILAQPQPAAELPGVGETVEYVASGEWRSGKVERRTLFSNATGTNHGFTVPGSPYVFTLEEEGQFWRRVPAASPQPAQPEPSQPVRTTCEGCTSYRPNTWGRQCGTCAEDGQILQSDRCEVPRPYKVCPRGLWGVEKMPAQPAQPAKGEDNCTHCGHVGHEGGCNQLCETCKAQPPRAEVTTNLEQALWDDHDEGPLSKAELDIIEAGKKDIRVALAREQADDRAEIGRLRAELATWKSCATDADGRGRKQYQEALTRAEAAECDLAEAQSERDAANEKARQARELLAEAMLAVKWPQAKSDIEERVAAYLATDTKGGV